MKFKSCFLCVLILVGVAAVSAQDVTVKADPRINFSTLKTYSWTAGVPARNPLIDTEIRRLTEESLASKGLRRLDSGGDISLSYYAAVDKELQISNSTWALNADWMGAIDNGYAIRNQMWDVEVGTLVICLADSSGKNLLWTARAKTMLDKKSKNQSPVLAMQEDAKKVQKRIKKSVEKMFKQYPGPGTAS
jgi:hypothetical protein